jgi:hypothetical protein
MCDEDIDSDNCSDEEVESAAVDVDQDELEYVEREDAGGEAEEDAGLDVMVEAFCDPARPSEKPTGPALKVVICKVSHVYVDSIDALPVDTLSVELRLLSGKNIKLTILRSAVGGRHPRLEILFSFHQMTALQIVMPDEDDDEPTMLEVDVCVAPDFRWNKSVTGTSGWQKGAPDFTPGTIATSGVRWNFALEKVHVDKMKEMLCSCRRVKLLLLDEFPASAKDCGEDGLEIYRENKKASIGSTQLPVTGNPVGALQRCNALLAAPDDSFKFTCFKCGFEFTQCDVRGNDFTHWYTRER